MEGEQRCDEQRIEIARPVEILDPEVELGISGYTKNLSASGMRARFDVAPAPGDSVQLLVTLVDDTEPLETQGKVIWSEEDASGDGAEVGLQFTSTHREEEQRKSARKGDAISLTPDFLKPGQRVTIDDANGHSSEAVVEEVASDGVIRISLFLHPGDAPSSSAPIEASSADEGDILKSADNWKPNPFRDAWNWLHKYARPVVAVIAKISLLLLSILVLAFRRIWACMPAKARDRVEASIQRLDLGRRVAVVRLIAISVYSPIASLISSLRSSVVPSRSGDT